MLKGLPDPGAVPLITVDAGHKSELAAPAAQHCTCHVRPAHACVLLPYHLECHANKLLPVVTVG